jgi:hypothetical protein
MPTPTYTPLANLTLGATASTVTFSSIPATYRDLILVIQGTGTAALSATIRFNGDTGNNYNTIRALGTGSSTVADTQTNVSKMEQFAFMTATQTTLLFNVMDYSATDKHKTVLARSGPADNSVWMGAGRWANTAAITSMALITSTSTFASGCTFSLYGVIA